MKVMGVRVRIRIESINVSKSSYKRYVPKYTVAFVCFPYSATERRFNHKHAKELKLIRSEQRKDLVPLGKA